MEVHIIINTIFLRVEPHWGSRATGGRLEVLVTGEVQRSATKNAGLCIVYQFHKVCGRIQLIFFSEFLLVLHQTLWENVLEKISPTNFVGEFSNNLCRRILQQSYWLRVKRKALPLKMGQKTRILIGPQPKQNPKFFCPIFSGRALRFGRVQYL